MNPVDHHSELERIIRLCAAFFLADAQYGINPTLANRAAYLDAHKALREAALGTERELEEVQRRRRRRRIRPDSATPGPM